MDPSRTLSLLSNIYLCKPSKEAIGEWTALLAEDTSIILQDLKEAANALEINSRKELDDVSGNTRGFLSAPTNCRVRPGNRCILLLRG